MKTILAAIDFSEMTPSVIELAARVASESSSQLCLLYVGPPMPDLFGQQIHRKVVTEGEVPSALAKEWQQLRHHERALLDRGIEASSRLVLGKPVEVILDEARRMDAELIVMGSQGKSTLQRVLMGSVCEGVMREATCPLLVVPRSEVEG